MPDLTTVVPVKPDWQKTPLLKTKPSLKPGDLEAGDIMDYTVTEGLSKLGRQLLRQLIGLYRWPAGRKRVSRIQIGTCPKRHRGMIIQPKSLGVKPK